MRSLPLAPALTQQLSPFLVVVNLRGHTQETTAALPRASSPNRDNGLGWGDEGYVEGGGVISCSLSSISLLTSKGQA